MKNKTLSLLSILTAILISTACHKCVECTESTTNGGKVLEWPEICGKKKEIDEHRKYMESIVNPGSKVKCVERKTTLF